jgi:hypothetical protein
MQARPWEDNHLVWEIRSPAARKHRIGRASARRVMPITTPAKPTSHERKPLAWRRVGRDNRDRELEVIAVEIGAGREAFLPVIQVMSASLREWGDPGV